MTDPEEIEVEQPGSIVPGRRPGVRLAAIEVLNWGTFDKTVWRLELGGDNALLTGDIGSGKSTLVDAITTLLVPAQKIAYNKAAGAESRERDLRSYVLGYYKAERGHEGLSAKPVALRTENSFSVILGQFRNEGFGEAVSLAQFFWFREGHGQPVRFYVVADRILSIVDDFSNFGQDANALKKKLRKAGAEIFDSFPPYGAAFRRRFGIENEQALDLFLQTVSMKSVGDLTEFVRDHMLEPFPVEERIAHMMEHFDDLTRAHEAVLKARAQIERLTPIVADCNRHAALQAEIDELTGCREALRPFFSNQKAGLLKERTASYEGELGRLSEKIKSQQDRKRARLDEQDGVKQAIMANGGDRIASISREIEAKSATQQERLRRFESYGRIASGLGFSQPTDADDFVSQRGALQKEAQVAEERRGEADNRYFEFKVEWNGLRDEHAALTTEISSLKGRRSNIPSRMLAIRDGLCTALAIAPDRLPFAGELIEVRKEAREWEGAAERLLRGFAVSILVPEEHYPDVTKWVNDTHLGGRLVYYRVFGRSSALRPRRDARSLSQKLAIKDNSTFYEWLQREVDDRFDHICCNNLDEFRTEDRAITKNGQSKYGGKRHEKDDRTNINDRTQYVLGWSNESKIAALSKSVATLEKRMQVVASAMTKSEGERKGLQQRIQQLQQLSNFDSFRDVDWRSIALEIDRLKEERQQLESASDVLKTLQAQLEQIEAALKEIEGALQKLTQDEAKLQERCAQANTQLEAALIEVAGLDESSRTKRFPQLAGLQLEALGDHRLTVEGCDKCEQKVREWLQRKIDNENGRLRTLRDRIVGAMRDYSIAYPEDTREVDASVDGASEYRRMLAALEDDGLPRFEAKFKALLNENTIREIAGFQSQLKREARDIVDRVATINQSLLEIDYNPGRYIVLEAQQNNDVEIREFGNELRACTENTLTGSEDSAYSEAKFLQVKSIIERFSGREGLADHDRRWTRKVTDVRNWFVFSASERRRSDGGEHEHYSGSSGKSGGQKEKLAYTVLAASLAYQFGLDWNSEQSRSFHFTVIDEAFGRGSDESARYGLKLFSKMGLQLLIATPLQKIHIIEPYVAAVGFVHNEDGRKSLLRNLTIEEYRAERLRRAG
jgi:uncharacterized protein YPO0396